MVIGIAIARVMGARVLAAFRQIARSSRGLAQPLYVKSLRTPYVLATQATGTRAIRKRVPQLRVDSPPRKAHIVSTSSPSPPLRQQRMLPRGVRTGGANQR